MDVRKPKLLDQVREAIRTRHYSRRTEDVYVQWIRRYIVFHRKAHPSAMGAPEIAAFLGWLAVERHVSASTQNQALSAQLFLYREVLRADPGACRREHDDDLHARGESWRAGRQDSGRSVVRSRLAAGPCRLMPALTRATGGKSWRVCGFHQFGVACQSRLAASGRGQCGSSQSYACASGLRSAC